MHATRRSGSGVRYTGPIDPPKGNVFMVCINDGIHKPYTLNPCSYGIAMAFAERWNRKTGTDHASVVFIEGTL